MKELSIEQKAKRYDELKVTAQELEHDGCFDKITLFDLFPELKESEDERIRNEIIAAIKEDWPGHTDWIAWIEEQANHANFRNKIQVGDKVTKNEDGVLVNLSQLKRVAKKDEQILANSAKTCKDEQKPADKIEPKQEWNEEDEERMKNILSVLDVQMCWNGATGKQGKPYQKEINWLKSLKDRVYPKQEWSEEDNQYLCGLIGLIEQSKAEIPITLKGKAADNCIDWLKSIKDRVQPQSKQGCCECDEIDIQTAIEICKNAGYDLIANRLKSLRPQNRWKPSDEQMDELRKYSNNVVLRNLYYSLKKLK